MLDTKALTHELQLGNLLNKSVQQGRRADFSLMLAMLTQDVKAHSQFLVPETEPTTTEITTDTLRKKFELPTPQIFGLGSLNKLDDFNQAHLANANLQASIKLKNTLKPLPICFRDNATHIPTSTLKNTSIHCQERLLNKVLPHKFSMNAASWLNSIKSTLAVADMNNRDAQTV